MLCHLHLHHLQRYLDPKCRNPGSVCPCPGRPCPPSLRGFPGLPVRRRRRHRHWLWLWIRAASDRIRTAGNGIRIVVLQKVNRDAGTSYGSPECSVQEVRAIESFPLGDTTRVTNSDNFYNQTTIQPDTIVQPVQQSVQPGLSVERMCTYFYHFPGIRENFCIL